MGWSKEVLVQHANAFSGERLAPLFLCNVAPA